MVLFFVAMIYLHRSFFAQAMLARRARSTRRRVTKYFKLYDKIAQGYDLALGPFLRHGQKMALNALEIKPTHWTIYF